jgi:hypothetical protein
MSVTYLIHDSKHDFVITSVVCRTEYLVSKDAQTLTDFSLTLVPRRFEAWQW